MTIKTPKGTPSFDYISMTVRLGSMNVSVKACQTAFLLLTTRPPDTTGFSYQLSLTPGGASLTASGRELATGQHPGRTVIAIKFYRLSGIYYFGVDMLIYDLLGISQIQGRFKLKKHVLWLEKYRK